MRLVLDKANFEPKIFYRIEMSCKQLFEVMLREQIEMLNIA